MSSVPKLDSEILRNLCAIIGDTEEGLSGSQIAKHLYDSGIADPEPTITKRDRLFLALNEKQNRDGCSNNIFSFLKKVMRPVNYVKNKELFENRRKLINQVILFAGFELDQNGEISRVKSVMNLEEAEQRADALSSHLRYRKVHTEVLKYCRPELLQKNYFHAVLEAVKGVASRLRSMSGLVSDGADLIDEVFNTSNPYILINKFITSTERSEHTGFMNLVKGVFGMFRNVTAHAAKIEWPIQEEEALDLLALVSLIHKKLDKATIVKTV